MPDTAKNIAIGSLVAIALGLLLWVLLFLHPSFGDGKFRLHVRFNDIEKINVGTRVTYAGRAVGEVVKIAQVPEEDRHSNVDPEDIFIYDLTLAIDSTIPLYDSDEITVGTSGLMGERFVAIIPKRPKNHKASPIAFNEVIYSTKPHSMDDAFAQISRLAMKAEETMDVLASLVKENRQEVDQTLVAIKGAATQLNSLLENTNNSDIIGKMDLFMNDINRYGVLYHLDKSWQRDRKRAEETIAQQTKE